MACVSNVFSHSWLRVRGAYGPYRSVASARIPEPDCPGHLVKTLRRRSSFFEAVSLIRGGNPERLDRRRASSRLGAAEAESFLPGSSLLPPPCLALLPCPPTDHPPPPLRLLYACHSGVRIREPGLPSTLFQLAGIRVCRSRSARSSHKKKKNRTNGLARLAGSRRARSAPTRFRRDVVYLPKVVRANPVGPNASWILCPRPLSGPSGRDVLVSFASAGSLPPLPLFSSSGPGRFSILMGTLRELAGAVSASETPSRHLESRLVHVDVLPRSTVGKASWGARGPRAAVVHRPDDWRTDSGRRRTGGAAR